MSNLFVISAPSGAGKTSLIKALLETEENLSLSISHTTREKRPTEIDGKNYHFVSKNEFKTLIKNNELLEYAKVFDNYYGTSKKTITEQLKNKIDVILEIDWQGHQQIKQHFKKAISIFILPPSIEELKSRLVKRGEDDKNTINKRMSEAKNEIKHFNEYDYLIINNNFSTALNELTSIFKTYSLTLDTQKKRHHKLLQSF
ncbi:Guanylate kinase [hydrothermal vent metagenome]|uniref:guanylate kinase n=1 Tax=hydrothermal vent metagenome TaxID=652676 RepID=A0A1W1CQG1_9ZZZZ